MLLLWLCKCFSAFFNQVMFLSREITVRYRVQNKVEAPSIVVHLISTWLYLARLVRYSAVYNSVLHSVCDNLIFDVGLHDCLQMMWFSPCWSTVHLVLHVRFLFFVLKADGGRQHTMMMNAVKWRVFIGRSSVLFFSKALKFRMCNCHQVLQWLSTASALPRSRTWLHTEY